MILALETATNVCSVAFKDGKEEVYEKRSEERGAHSENLFLFIEALMKEHSFEIADLDAFLISEGPGSYTGLRIAASAVKGLLFGKQVRLYAVNTLASFAMAVSGQNSSIRTIHSIIDARRVHVYHQQFSRSGYRLEPESQIEVIPIKNFEDQIMEGDAIIGTGLSRIDESVRSKAELYDLNSITARSLIRLFEAGPDQSFIREISPEMFEPNYYTSRQIK